MTKQYDKTNVIPTANNFQSFRTWLVHNIAEIEKDAALVPVDRRYAVVGLGYNCMTEFLGILDDWTLREARRNYEAASDMRDYCERYEPTYNPKDGSM